MDFSLSKEYEMLRKLYEGFAENEVKPLAKEIDDKERFPTETVPKMTKVGLFGGPFPERYGGGGGDNLGYIMAVETLSSVCATTGVLLSAHVSLCAAPIYENGNDEQKQRFLVPLAKGEYLGAFALTEAGAGTDAAMQQTTAVLDGGEYVLNGTKIFITNAAHAHVFVIIAMTDKSKGTRGCSAFIVPSNAPGFSIGKEEKKMGIRGSSTCELIMENCRIPKENILGKEGDGFKIAMKTLDGGRIGIAAQALGISQGAINEAVTYVRERKQFGRRISQFQNTQFQLADMQTRTDAARLLTYRAAWAKDQGMPYGHLAAMAKLFASETASDVTRRCVQLLGGYGYTREYPLERMMRDAKITEIYEGTSEVQKMVISAYMKVN